MTDPRFYSPVGPLALGRLAEIAAAALAPGADPRRMFRDVAPLHLAGAEEVSFLDNRRYRAALEASRAGACVLHPDLASAAPAGMMLLLSDHPYRAYALIARAFHAPSAPKPGVAASAVIAAAAALGPDCEVGPGAVIESAAAVGARTVIGANVWIGPGVVIGEDCRIGANATLSHCLVGDRVVIHRGVCIGEDGFGFATSREGHLPVPQLGRVIIGDDVDIGANTTIDRGSGPDTVIGPGCRIDNLVQIGHNVVLGRGCVVVAQVGISGSTKVGDFVMLGGQVGIAGHLSIGDGARVAAKSGVSKDVPPGTTVSGYPAFPVKEHWRQVATLARLAKRETKGD
ncbi:MAG: UDP-3-O-(3-hydroxymyristoyl)glucosamine N-acyltransferase [Proteobacteria bacterium]|nr:UDP-3-O-(3-hydroxymyristoyl)glucosamine N-acyltransferase [Pseudomonadota bacterium]